MKKADLPVTRSELHELLKVIIERCTESYRNHDTAVSQVGGCIEAGTYSVNMFDDMNGEISGEAPPQFTPRAFGGSK